MSHCDKYVSVDIIYHVNEQIVYKQNGEISILLLATTVHKFLGGYIKCIKPGLLYGMFH